MSKALSPNSCIEQCKTKQKKGLICWFLTFQTLENYYEEGIS